MSNTGSRFSKFVLKSLGASFVLIVGSVLGWLMADLDFLTSSQPALTVLVPGKFTIVAPDLDLEGKIEVNNSSGHDLTITGMVLNDCSNQPISPELPLRLPKGGQAFLDFSLTLEPGVGVRELPFVIFTDKGNVSDNCLLVLEVVAPPSGTPTLAPKI